MGRAVWSGNISFGLVTIPVRLHTATETNGIAFHLLHKECDTRIQEHRWCPECEENVDWDDIVKGYEYAKNHYVELTKDDFEKLPLPSKHTIDVSDFVALSEIDPIYFDSSYYIEVQEGSEKAYRLLLDALASKDLAAIATIAFRTRERLCALRAMQDELVLQTLLYQDEIKENDNQVKGTKALSAQEKKIADTFVSALTTTFEPEKFKDNYKIALTKLIKAKLKGKELKVLQFSEPTAGGDLMEALKASVARAAKGRGGHKAPARKTKTKSRSGAAVIRGKAKKTKKAA